MSPLFQTRPYPGQTLVSSCPEAWVSGPLAHFHVSVSAFSPALHPLCKPSPASLSVYLLDVQPAELEDSWE